jgi:transcription-repair coupling factor (superfamily II helicase)
MLDAVLATLRERPALRTALAAARGGGEVRLEGLSGPHLAAVLAQLQLTVQHPLAVVVPADVDLEVLLIDVRTFHPAGGSVVAFPSLDVNPYGSVPPHDDIVRERLQTLNRCSRGRVEVLLAPVRCWMERIQSPTQFRSNVVRIEVGAQVAPESIAERLVGGGYRHVSLVESLGEFAVRGGILDVFPPTREHPVRLEFFGDEIDSMREFNPRDQRSMRAVKGLELPPAVSRAADDPESAGDAGELAASLADYLEERLWVMIEPEVIARNADRWQEYLDEHYHQAVASGQDMPIAIPASLVHPLEHAVRAGEPRVTVAEFASGQPGAYDLTTQSAPGYRGRLAELAHALKTDLAAQERVVFLLARSGKAQRLAEILDGYDVATALQLDPERESNPDAEPIAHGSCNIATADLSGGFRVPEIGLWVGTDAEIFGRARPQGRRRRFHGEAFKGDFRDLTPDDYVIHEEHGIGRFVGLKQIEVGDIVKEFMEIEYRGTDRLYLPLDQLYLVQKFNAGEEAKPRIDRLGGTSWSKVKSRVKSSLREVATELLELYAARKTESGHAFGPDTPWQREMEDSFEYEETPDQLRAIAEVKQDMEASTIMDRLLCGDVGYGKTEVAMRAAFKAVMDGKQVAMLAPTTVLAFQHGRTLRERFAAFPVRVDTLSRFATPAETRATLKAIKDGTADIVIGTHRLLAKDVQFKNLGLLIIDEEQRFGVGQKERLKHLKRSVDVLSMTATPIPRTLQMSLLGVRDLSIIETPPRDRYAIATHIVPYDHEILAHAIHEELSRGGQVFVVHNRIESIYRLAKTMQDLVPEAEFRVAHGQLPKVELETVMLDFVEGRADVLVTTTIIENGLDIPMANTIIINRADGFGLAQLYQLRGRVGRSTRRAYAYLVVPPVDTLTPIAKQRLRAIQEFSDLGSGFRLAAMDLEIRGAGSLLGERQHGQIAAVGFEMYARLLEEAVHELKGEEFRTGPRAQVSLGVDLQVPVDYVEDPLQRLMVSKRLASANTIAQLEALQNELRDRYGPLPAAVDELFAVATLRQAAESIGVLGIERQGDRLAFRLGERTPIRTHELATMLGERPEWSLTPPDRLMVTTGERPVAELISCARDVLDALPLEADDSAGGGMLV